MPLKTIQDEMPSINLTPMIDIVFQLIIFFMVGSRFTELEKKMDLQVPSVSSTAAMGSVPERYLVNVFRDGRITLNQEPVDPPLLTSRLAAARQQHGDVIVTVRGDGGCDFQAVATAMAACRDAGVEMGVSVRMAQKGK